MVQVSGYVSDPVLQVEVVDPSLASICLPIGAPVLLTITGKVNLPMRHRQQKTDRGFNHSLRY